jgi:hypothetical protein
VTPVSPPSLCTASGCVTHVVCATVPPVVDATVRVWRAGVPCAGVAWWVPKELDGHVELECRPNWSVDRTGVSTEQTTNLERRNMMVGTGTTENWNDRSKPEGRTEPRRCLTPARLPGRPPEATDPQGTQDIEALQPFYRNKLEGRPNLLIPGRVGVSESLARHAGSPFG